ncbi:hypothetical protein C0431_02030 [bacterium]|nr:hypothetical protein [bacterium]
MELAGSEVEMAKRLTIHEQDIWPALLGIFVTLIYFAVIFSGVKEFSLWQQILDLGWANPLELIRSFHPHALRLLVVFPFLFASELTDISADRLFSVAVPVFMIVSSWLCARVLAHFVVGNSKRVWLVYQLTALPLFGLSFIMNGRIAFAILGLSVLTYCLIFSFTVSAWTHRPNPIWIIVGLLLTSVSSGALVVGFLFLAITSFGWAFRTWPKLSRWLLFKLSFSIFGLVFVSPIFIAGLIKNIRFYGGFVEMLRHGAGKVLPADPVLAVLTSLSFVAFGLVACTWVLKGIRRGSPETIIGLACLLGIAGGAFGFSTLASAVPIYFLSFYIWFFRRNGVNVSPTEIKTA